MLISPFLFDLCVGVPISSRDLLRDCKISYNSWEPSFEALHSRPGWGHGARRRHTTSVILPSTVSWLAEHRALSHCRVSLHHRDMGARYLHRISTYLLSTQGIGWPDASPQDHQLAEVRVDGSMSSAGWSNRFPLEIRAQVDIE